MTTKTISEETRASMVEAAQNIAENSTAMRKAMINIAKDVMPIARNAGVIFSVDGLWWNHEYTWYTQQRSLGIMRDGGGWVFAIHALDPVTDRIIIFENASREDIINAAKHIPTFLLAYCEELEQQNHDIIDFREKADAMLKILEG